MFARSLARSRRVSGCLSTPHIRMIISYSPNMLWESAPLPDQPNGKQSTMGITQPMTTTPTRAEPSVETAGARRATTARGDDNGDARTTSTVDLAATQHTTRREVIGGGADDREGGWTKVERACMHARAAAVFVNARN